MSDKKEFPRTGFGRLAGDMVRRYYTHDVARDSAALTYYLLFAIFPLLIFISTLLGLLELDGAYIASVLEPLLPADVLNVLQSYLDYVSANQSRQLLWFSLVFSIWFPMRAAGCLMHSVRKAFGCGAPESMWRSQLRILLFTVCLILSIAITLVLVVVGRTVLEFAGRIITVSEAFITAWSYLRFVALALACRRLVEQGALEKMPLIHYVAGVSAGIVDDTPVLDLPYSEDSRAQVDLNCMMTEQGEIIELQGTGEGRPFTVAEQQTLVSLCAKGCCELMEKQKEIVGEIL